MRGPFVKFRFLTFCAAGALLANCVIAAPKVGGSPNIRVMDMTELPPPDRADIATRDRPYMVGPFDKLTIDVFGMEEISQKETQVDASGRISFPMVGVVQVGGKTTGEIEKFLEQALAARYVRNPQVTVNLKETVSQVVTVDGEVKKPAFIRLSVG
jgi:polysaccharide export outer membrane protein